MGGVRWGEEGGLGKQVDNRAGINCYHMKHSGESRVQKENDTENRWYFYGYIKRKWG